MNSTAPGVRWRIVASAARATAAISGEKRAMNAESCDLGDDIFTTDTRRILELPVKHHVVNYHTKTEDSEVEKV